MIFCKLFMNSICQKNFFFILFRLKNLALVKRWISFKTKFIFEKVIKFKKLTFFQYYFKKHKVTSFFIKKIVLLFTNVIFFFKLTILKEVFQKKNSIFLRKKYEFSRKDIFYKKKFTTLCEYSFFNYQYFQQNINEKRMEKFSTLWNKGYWINFLLFRRVFFFKKFPFLFRVYSKIFFIILIHAQTRIFFQKEKNLNYSKKNFNLNFLLFCNFLKLNRRWKSRFCFKQKILTTLKHITYNSDLCVDWILNTFKLSSVLKLNTINLVYEKTLTNSFILLTRYRLTMVYSTKFFFAISNMYKKFVHFNYKFEISKRNSLLVHFKHTNIKQENFKLWYSMSIDSHFTQFSYTIEINIFRYINYQNLFLLYFLFCNIKKISNFKKNIFSELFKHRLNFSIHKKNIVHVFFMYTTFIKHIKIYFEKTLQFSRALFFFATEFCHITAYYIFQDLNEIINYQKKIKQNYILILKINKIFNLRVEKKNSRIFKKTGNNLILFQFFDSIEKTNKKIIISLLIKKTKKIEGFRFRIKKKNLIFVVIFFCSKFFVNFGIIQIFFSLKDNFLFFLKSYVRDSFYFLRNSKKKLHNSCVFLHFIYFLILKKYSVFPKTLELYKQKPSLIFSKFLEKSRIYWIALLKKKQNICISINQILWKIHYKRMGILFLALRISNNTNFEEKKELVKNFLYKNKIKQKFAFAQNLLLTNYKKINTKCLLHIINFVVIRYTVLIIRYNFFKKAGKIVGDLYTFLITRHLEKKFYKKINQNSMTGYQFNSDTKKIFFEYILYFIFYIHEKTLKLRKEYNTVKKSQQFSHKLYKEKEIWPEIGFINYQSNQIIHIGNIESIQKHGIYGTLNLDFRFYIKLKNKVLFPLVFSFFIKNFIRIFPAKIFKSCYYAKKAFFYFSKQINFFLFFKNIYLFLCWLEKQNWLNYYNIIFKKFYLF